MPRLVAIVCFLFVCQSIVAQTPDCSCETNLDSVFRRISVNYPGFSFRDQKEINNLFSKTRTEATLARTPKDCHTVIFRFLKWFGDGHLGISYSGDVFKPKEVRPQKTPVWQGLNEQVARMYIDSLPQPDSLEGIWESYESFYKAIIRKNANGIGYKAYLIHTINENWKTGEVKMEFLPTTKGNLACTFYTSDHSPEYPSFTLEKNILEVNKITVWNRIYPASRQIVPVEAYVSARYKWTEEFRQWDKDVFYIQLQNLTAGVKPLIDSLVKQNRKQILASQTLIIDLRDNEGGDLTVFDALWPFILNRPAVLFGTSYFCTEANIQSYTRQIRELDGQIDPEFREMAEEMAKHKGGFWTIPNDTLLPDTVFPLPAKVILLVNGQCKSSTEDFILTARSSPKVIIAGQPTGGVADFEETIDVPLPCPSLILNHPIGVSNRLPGFILNEKGISPDILLKSGSKAWQPWVREVLRLLKRTDVSQKNR